MKKLYFLVLFSCCYIFIAAQTHLSSEKWQEDLVFLQNTIHDDYPFLFKKITSEVFDAEVDKLKKYIPSLEQHEIVVGFARIVSLFEYGHTSIGLFGGWAREQFQFNQMQYNLHHFRDGIFIQGTTKSYAKALGAQVLKIQGIDINQALAAIKPVVPSENDEFFESYGLYLLGCPEVLHAQGVTPKLQKNITLTLEKEGEIFEETFSPVEGNLFPRHQYTYVQEEGDWLDARDNTTNPLYLKNLKQIYYYEYLPEYKTVYIRHSQIQDDPEENIPDFYERVFQFVESNDVEKLVLDVRLNGGGNNYKNKPIVTNIIRSKINKPGKFFVIIGGQTYSACQNLVNELDNYTEAVFLGEPTGENINFYGDNRRIELPNSQIPVSLSFAWWQDKPQWENADWLAPHIAKELSFKEYVNNQDPVLDIALNFSEDNFILDPKAYFTELYTSGQSDKLMTEAVRLINDPNYKFFNFESEFNQLGYDLLGRGETQTALSVFGFIVSLFPESANAWDSLAEANWKSGNIEKAKEFYAKAISMDPNGNVGDNARQMLKKMQAHN